MKMKMQVENITPTMAQEILANNEGNRMLNDRTSITLAKQMTDGNWKFNGEPIIISDHGNLMDGQHRLNAIIRSGTTQQMLVIRGIEQNAFDTIDVGKNRTGTDVLSTEGIARKEAACLATVIKLDTLIKYNGTFSHNLSNDHLYTPSAILESHNGNVDYLSAVEFLFENTGTMKNLPISAGYLALIIYRTFQIDKDFSEDWIKRFISGVGVTDNENMMHLRNKFWSENNSKRKTPNSIRALWTIRAWELDRKKRFIKSQYVLCKGGAEILRHISLPTDVKSKSE